MSDSVWFGVGVVVIGVVLAIVVPIGVINHISFPVDVARIESLRADVQRVGAAESEDVIGQVTQVNQGIASAQAQNRIPVWCLAIPNGWDTVRPIQIPERGMSKETT